MKLKCTLLSLIILLFSEVETSAQGDLATEEKEKVEALDYSTPGEFKIGGITVSGTKHLDPDILVTLSGLKVGQTIQIPGDEISKAMANLWRQGLFTDVQIYRTKTVGNTMFLEIHLQERARMSRFTLEGIKKGDADDLREKIRLIKGRVVTENTKSNTVNIIKSFYQEKGFYNTRVNISELPDSMLTNSILLKIEIDKGSKVKIADININGNESYSDIKLHRKMKETKEKAHFHPWEIFKVKNMRAFADSNFNFIDWLNELSPSKLYKYTSQYANFNIFSGSKLIEKEYENDKQNIIDFYQKNGYRDARILNDTFYVKDGEIYIDIDLVEGFKYYFRNITWKGNTIYSDEKLSEILDIKKGTVYDRNLLDERLFMSQAGNDVSSLYMDDGYLFFQVTPVEIAVEEDSIDVEVRIYEGPQATIDEIRIYGNTKTNEKVIRRELRTLPGNKFSRSDLIRSQREIAQLNYFDPEQMDVRPIPNPEEGTVDIEYHVVEKPSDQLELSAGWGGRGRGVVGTVGISFTNFSIQNLFDKSSWSPLPSGDGQQLSLRVQTNGKVFQSYNISFTEPWMGGKKPNSFTVSYYHSRFADLNYSTREVRGRLITNSASVGIGTRLKWPDDFFVFQTSLNFQTYKLDNWTSSNFIITDGTSNNFNVNFTLSRSSIDAPYFPKRGSNFSLSLALTPPYSAFNNKDYSVMENNDKYRFIEYHKWKVKAEWFLQIKGNLVLRTAAKLGFMGYYNKDIGYSPFERFELGGDGLSNFQFFGRDIIALRGYEVGTPSSGSPFYNKFTTELRYAFSTNPSSTIYAHAFFEAGNYWNNIKEYNPFELARTVGLGVRIFLPMFGLLGFDYGIGFDKEMFENVVIEKPTSFGDFLGKYGKFTIVLGFEPE